MTKLISSIVAIVLATATLATAAPKQSTVRKSGTAARAKVVKTSKPANRVVRRKAAPAKYRRAATAPRPAPKPATPAYRPLVTAHPPAFTETIAPARHDVMAEEQQLKRLKSDLKIAEKAGDQRRVSRDRRELYRLEADVRADKADLEDQKRLANGGKKRSRIPFWGWWRRG